jgi:hypothetical protein
MSPSRNPRRGSATAAPAEAALPPADTCHWVARRKAQVVEAVQSGRLSFDEARRRYRLSGEEFGAWKRAFLRHGVEGLRAAGSGLVRAAKRRVRRSSARRAHHG